MIIKPERRKKCKSCGRELTWVAATEGCDTCKKPFGKDDAQLDVKVFHKGNTEATQSYVFCCWKCAIKFIKKAKSDYFITLPFLHCDGMFPKGQRFEDFLKLLK